MKISKELTEQVAKDLFQIIPLLRKNIMKPFEKISENLSPLQFHVLLFLKDKKPRSMSELAAEMNVLKQQLTFLTDKLAENNYVQRIPDDKDRRCVKISITQEGIRYLESFKKDTIDKMVLKLERLSVEDLNELHYAIQSLYKITTRL
ncbi:MAG: MarR family transcriptional regulator [Peptococcaceae bacterium]|nr:MarR family transcriptional regulator [Peptococcaceae bacterium]